MATCNNNPGTPDESLEQLAEDPQSVSVDGQSLTNHSISQRIELDRYNNGKKARRQGPFGGLSFGRVNPGSTRS